MDYNPYLPINHQHVGEEPDIEIEEVDEDVEPLEVSDVGVILD